MSPTLISYILNTGSDIVGKKWRGTIIWHLQHGPLRFNELHGYIPDISTKMLSQILKEMESNKLIVRTQYNTIPVRVEYQIHPESRDMIDACVLAAQLFAGYVVRNHDLLKLDENAYQEIKHWLESK